MFQILSILRHYIIRINFFGVLKFIEGTITILVRQQLILIGFTYQKKALINNWRNVIVRVRKIIILAILLNLLKSLNFSAEHLIIQRYFDDSFIIWVFNVSAVIYQSKWPLINFLTDSKFIINNLTFYFTRKQINFSMQVIAINLILVLRWLKCL